MESPDLLALCSATAESAFPALVVAAASNVVVSASAPARQLLAPGGDDVLGRCLEDFIVGSPSDALPLLMSGRLDGYETTRELHRDGAPVAVTAWIRRADDHGPPEHLVVILTAPDRAAERLLPQPPGAGPAPVLGSTGPDLLVDRISSDVEALVGIPAERLLGQSLLSLVTSDSASRLLWGLAQATTHGRGAPLDLTLARADGTGRPAQLLVVPLQPPASCAFSILPAGPDVGPDLTPVDAHVFLARLVTGIDSLGTARQLAGISASRRIVLSLLSARELDVVTRLMAGERVPAIAKALFLSPSTVRNQLSSVFTKTGVHSQQELIDLLRDRDEVSARS